MHPAWIAVLVVVGTLCLIAFIAFLAYITEGVNVFDMVPRGIIRVNRYGPKHCPHCGKRINKRTSPQTPAVGESTYEGM